MSFFKWRWCDKSLSPEWYNTMVFRSRALPFYLKIKTPGLKWKLQTSLKLRPLKKHKARDRKSARARERDFSLAVSLLLPCPRTLPFSSLAFFKTRKFQTRLRFKCENLAFLFLNEKARLKIASGPNGTLNITVIQKSVQREVIVPNC